MHTWAEASGACSYVFQTNYKQEGNTSVHRYMQLVSKRSQAEEDGLALAPHDRVALAKVQEEVQSVLAMFFGGEDGSS